MTYVAALTGGKPSANGETPEAVVVEGPNLHMLQSKLAKYNIQLAGILSTQWKEYLALPAEVFDGQRVPNEQALSAALARYDNIARTVTYANLAKRPEFQATHELLRELTGAVAASQRGQIISLPPPPATEQPNFRR